MAAENLQTIIVSKSLAKTRAKAEKIARPFAHRIYTSRQTKTSWRFRQRPPSDFKKNTFRSFPLPGKPGIILVYGDLKKSKKREGNPSQRFLQWRGQKHDCTLRDWDFWMGFYPRVKKARSAKTLRLLAVELEKRGILCASVQTVAVGAIADRARNLRITQIHESIANDEKIVNDLISGRMHNPAKARRKTAKKRAKKPTKKRAKKAVKKAPTYIKLRAPKEMPDPGPVAWLGSIVEWAWVAKPGERAKRDENGNAIWLPRGEWMFNWSPKYKAIVAIRRPKRMYELAEVSRYGGAAKMFEVFAARPAEKTFEIEVPGVKLHQLGMNAGHIVYRSDKWSPERKKTDYIHPFEKGVKLYCGPSIKKPEVFLCFGGKLTLTKRGLVY